MWSMKKMLGLAVEKQAGLLVQEGLTEAFHAGEHLARHLAEQAPTTHLPFI